MSTFSRNTSRLVILLTAVSVSWTMPMTGLLACGVTIIRGTAASWLISARVSSVWAKCRFISSPSKSALYGVVTLQTTSKSINKNLLWHTHTHTRLTAFCPGLPRWTGIRKEKPILILLKQETVSGSGIHWVICKSAPCSRQITTPVPHYTQFFTGRMPFLPPNQQRQSTEGKSALANLWYYQWQWQRFHHHVIRLQTFHCNTKTIINFLSTTS